jgi:ankyrin repeat protein
MHDIELENAILLCEETTVEAILNRDRSRALSTDDQGKTLVMSSVSMGMEANGVSLLLLRQLLDAGVDINAQDTESNTALALAVGECPTEVVRFLLTRGADPNLGNPLIHAPWNDGTSVEDLEGLVAAGADPRAQEVDDMNALESAQQTVDEDFVRVLKRAARRGGKKTT